MELRDADFEHAVVCFFDNGQDKQYVFLNSCLPIYLQQRQRTMPAHEYAFLKLIPTKRRETSQAHPCPTIDTRLLSRKRLSSVITQYKTENADCYASFNDVLAVKVAIAKAQKQQQMRQ